MLSRFLLRFAKPLPILAQGTQGINFMDTGHRNSQTKQGLRYASSRVPTSATNATNLPTTGIKKVKPMERKNISTLQNEKPKKAKNMFQLFLADYVTSHPEYKGSLRYAMGPGAIAYKALSEQEKKKYQEQYEIGHEEYLVAMKKWEEKVTADGHRTDLPRKLRNKGAPKRPLTSYIAFFLEQHEAGKVRNVNEAVEAWRKLSDDDKKKYSPNAEDMKIYKEKYEEWKKEVDSGTVKSSEKEINKKSDTKKPRKKDNHDSDDEGFE